MDVIVPNAKRNYCLIKMEKVDYTFAIFVPDIDFQKLAKDELFDFVKKGKFTILLVTTEQVIFEAIDKLPNESFTVKRYLEMEDEDTLISKLFDIFHGDRKYWQITDLFLLITLLQRNSKHHGKMVVPEKDSLMHDNVIMDKNVIHTAQPDRYYVLLSSYNLTGEDLQKYKIRLANKLKNDDRDHVFSYGDKLSVTNYF